MTYTPDQPQDLPSPDIATTQIRTNFAQYAQVFDNNHVALNSANQGKHTHVILQEQSVDPVVNSNLDVLYGKSVTSNTGASQQAFLKIPRFLPNNKPNIPQQLTFGSVDTTGPLVYQSFIAGGYVVYFGTAAATGTISLAPQPTEIVCAIANTNNFTGGLNPFPFNVSVQVLNNFQFSINSTLGGGTFTWVAIARQ